MSDTPDTALDGGAPTPAEADRPGEGEDEFADTTPPDVEEGEETPEAG
jgi:hypothetical protein